MRRRGIEPEAERKNGKAPAQQRRPATAGEPVRTASCGGKTCPPHCFVLTADVPVILYLLQEPKGSKPGSVVLSVALLMVFFIPFSYFMDSLNWGWRRSEPRRRPHPRPSSGARRRPLRARSDRDERLRRAGGQRSGRGHRRRSPAATLPTAARARRGRNLRASRSSGPTRTGTISAAWPILAEGTGCIRLTRGSWSETSSSGRTSYYTQLGPVAIRGSTPEHTLCRWVDRSRPHVSRWTALVVPGHSPGHLTYCAEGAVFSGDVLFAGSVGHVDLPLGDWETLLASPSTRSPIATRPRPSAIPATARRQRSARSWHGTHLPR